MIDLVHHPERRRNTIIRARERGIIIPTFEQMKDPGRIPSSTRKELAAHGLWDLHPINLFRITWKNEAVAHGGGFGGVNFLELPSSLTGVRARILALVGKWFPTGAHKVGATFGCLVPRLITGQFDPTFHKAVWPSTGNYCRGGAYNAALLGCDSIAVLPEEMSQERFEWLSRVAGEVIATPGCESNVWEIFQKCKELRATRDNVVVFDQFEEFGNHLWHYDVTGHAMEEVLTTELKGDRFAGVVLTSGSAGTLGSGDYLKERFPAAKVVAAEALQCPTLLENGFGGHRIEGIGDKHIPWIHNVRNTDVVAAVDDESALRLVRLFNEPAGREYLQSVGVGDSLSAQLDLLGISGIANLMASIKFAKYFELTERDVILTVLTDSMELYGTRLRALRDQHGPYTSTQAAIDYDRCILGLSTDAMLELGYRDRKRIHNLKYFTWVEQMEQSAEELNRQWYDHEAYWGSVHRQVPEIDAQIDAFNQEVGLLDGR